MKYSPTPYKFYGRIVIPQINGIIVVGISHVYSRKEKIQIKYFKLFWFHKNNNNNSRYKL